MINVYAWVIDVDNYCCNNEWDPTCQEMYNYCENGWPEGVGIWENGRMANSIMVYPNPTKNILNINSSLEITYSLYDFTGKVLISNSSESEINLTNYSNGVYFLTIDYNGIKFNKKIIKK